MASFLAEIRRRKVSQVAAVYAVVAWLMIQIVATIEAPLQLPTWFDTAIIVLLIVGFPIAVILAWIYELSGTGLRRTPRADAPAATDSSTEQTLSAPCAPASDTVGPAILPNSIAVLPFENMSPDPDHAYFAAGIHEEILNSLAKLKSLNVIARTSVLQYAGTQQPIREIATALGVETVMEGSVRYAGKRVRVTTQLIGAGTGAHLWSEAYERDFDDIFAIQADIAVQVANALRAELTKEEQSRAEVPATKSTEAYALYLQAISNPSASETELVPLIDRAIALDPQFAPALGAKAAMLGMALINSSATVARNQAELDPLLRKYAAAALEIDPANSTALTALCVLAEFTWHWTEARAYALRVLETPSWGILAAGVNWTLSWSGEADLAIDKAERMQRLNPTDWSAPWNLGLVLNYARQYDTAATTLRRSIAMLPALPIHHSWLAVTEAARGDGASARRELELTEKLLGEERQVIYLLDMGYTYGRVGDAENAQRLFDEVRAIAAGHDIGAGGWALAHMAVGNYDEALEHLRAGAEKAARYEIDAGMFSLMNLKMNYTADPVLERPEFVAVRARLKGD